MKKSYIYVAICFLCACISIGACDPGSFSFNEAELLETVVSVELIHYHNPDQGSFTSWIPNQFNKLRPLNLGNITVLETLNNEYIEDFVIQLAKVDFLSKYYAYDSPADICLRVWYSNGDFEILYADFEHGSFSGYVGRYDSNGKVVDFTGAFTGLSDFTSLVNNFFETKLEK